eukprot:m51a1_g7299 hypothetical protein (572) ;mRNA; f:79837-82630
MAFLIKVTVVSARNLAPMDSNGKSDPYVILETGGSRKKTKIVKENLNPSWNETFSFQLKSQSGSLAVQVWDYDRASKDDFLGMCLVDITSVQSDTDTWFPLTPQQAKAAQQAYVTGEICLRLEKSANEKKLIPGDVVTMMKGRMKECLDAQTPELDLSGCVLPIVPKIVCEQFTFLRKLDISFNKLSVFPELAPLTGLEDLDLNGNQLTEIAAACTQLTALRFLSLNGNAISSIPTFIGRMTKLERLSLANNSITSLPKEIGRLQNLEELQLMGNALTTLPASVGALRSLNVVDVSCCQLQRLPDELTLATRLIDLNLGTNQLTQLPEGMGRLTRLVTLNVQDNNLTDLPLSLGKCPGLGELGYGINIARNPIKDELMLEKYAIGPDHLLDFLEKRYAIAGSPVMPPCQMPTDLGEGPPPAWAQPPKQAGGAQAASTQGVALSQKLAALKNWGINTVKDDLKGKVTQFRSEARGATSLNALLDIDYRIKGLNKEFEKVRPIAHYDTPVPKEPPQGSPPLEVLRSLTLAALNLVDAALRAVQAYLSTPGLSDINNVVKAIQVLTVVKSQFSK